MYDKVRALVVLLVITCVKVECSLIDGELLGSEIEKLVNGDGMGYNVLQDIYDRYPDLFEAFDIDGTNIVSEFAESMGSKFGGALEAVRNIKLTAEREYNKFSTSYQGFEICCKVNVSNFEKSAYLDKKVNLEEACIRVGGESVSKPVIPISQALLDAYRENYDNNRNIYWQYFGTEEGAHSLYPSQSSGSCTEYDPRYRPWYVETSIPTAKDVVIVLDRSQSMSNSNIMGLAKEAAQTVLGTLNPNDRMGLVSFSHKAFTPNLPGKYSCFSSELAFATPDNKRALQNYIGNITTEKNTMYKSALEKAYGLLNASATVGLNDARRRDKAIVFLTDGKPDESHSKVLQFLRNQTLRLDVKVLTYGIGDEVASGPAANLLQQMATETGGIYTQVDDAIDLRYKMGLYYNAFVSNRTSEEVVITAPYIDYDSLGLIVSMCMPVHHQGQFKGVCCIDLNVIDLIADAAFFTQGTSSYSFIIDGTGRVITHPLLTQPEDISRDSWEKDPVFLDIFTLEKSNTKQVIDSMIRGESGSLDLETKIVKPRADSRRDGVTSDDVMATYSWKKIPNVNMSICVVVVQSEQKLNYQSDSRFLYDQIRMNKFIYNRLDLDDTVTLCTHMGRLCTLDGPSVKFTPSAFKDPIRFIYEEDIEAAKRYKLFFQGSTDEGDDFKDGLGLRTIVALTQQMKSHWKSDYLYKEQRIWTYVGLQKGAYIHFPGLPYDRRYDHTKRPWYRQAMDNRGANVITAPYTDAGLAGTVLTICKTLYQGRKGEIHSKSDPVVGVLGMDLKLDTLRYILHNTFPDCSKDIYSCFLVDTSGYLLYHPDFHLSGELVESVHIILKEPSIAKDLITKSYLSRTQCNDFESKLSFHTWKLTIPSGAEDNLKSIPSYKAEIAQNTNFYIFIRSTGRTIIGEPCPCAMDGSLIKCKSEDKDSCECPCTTSTEFYYCLNTFPYTSDNPDMCYPSSPVLQFQRPTYDEEKLLNSAELCYPSNCTGKSEWECRSTPLCSWCDDGRCFSANKCPQTAVPPLPDDQDDDEVGDDSKIPMIAGIAGGIVLLLIILIVICIVVNNRKAKRKRSGDDRVVFSPSSASSIGRGSLAGLVNPPPSENSYHNPMPPDLQRHLPPHNRDPEDLYLNPDHITRPV